MEKINLTKSEVMELALNLDWGNPFENEEDILGSLRTNWETPLSDESVQAVYEEMCRAWEEKHE